MFKGWRPSAWLKRGALALGLAASMAASAQSIVMASTTSTEQSGLFGHLLP
ncbi:MAG: tungsten ABC transporter substrate-binding protein, partial [Burkholderiaceae bacterium]